MPANFPGPYQVRLFYQVLANGQTDLHVMAVNVDMNITADPGDEFSEWTCQSRFGAAPQLDTFVDNFVAALVPVYDDSSQFNYAELWEFTPESSDAAYLSSYTIGEPGTADSPPTFDRQDIYTFRSTNGGSGRLTLMQPIGISQTTAPYPTGTTIVNDLFDFVSDVQSPILARDNGYLFKPLNYLPGGNERLFKSRYRP